MKPEQKKEDGDSAPENAERQEPEKKAADYKEALQRLQADFENYRKRVEKEKADTKKHANAELMKALLPVIDSFELALKNTSEHEKFVKGVEMIYAQLYSTLEENGLKPIKAAGKQFDPNLHEALLQEESDKDETVLEELQKGYTMNDSVLRYAKVKIGKKAGEKKFVKEEDKNE